MRGGGCRCYGVYPTLYSLSYIYYILSLNILYANTQTLLPDFRFIL